MSEDVSKEKKKPSKPRSQMRAQARKLSAKTGLPENKAMAVVRGDRSLAEMISQLAEQDRIEMLMRKHDIDKGVATQAVRGDLVLEDYLSKQRLKSYVSENRERSHLKVGRTVRVWIHGQRRLDGVIRDLDPYEVEIESAEGEVVRLHKLQLKIVQDAGTSRELIEEFEHLEQAADALPVEAPQDRHRISDRRLLGWVEDTNLMEIHTLEGDVVRGHMDWFSRWELGLLTEDQGKSLGVFRHAIAQIERG